MDDVVRRTAMPVPPLFALVLKSRESNVPAWVVVNATPSPSFARATFENSRQLEPATRNPSPWLRSDVQPSSLQRNRLVVFSVSSTTRPSPLFLVKRKLRRLTEGAEILFLARRCSISMPRPPLPETM